MTQPITSFRGTHRFLSNFYMTPVHLWGVCFPSVEHAFQAAKTLDKKWHVAIWRAPTPTIAKALGKRVPLRADWTRIRVDVMAQCLNDKFRRTPALWGQLNATGDALLVEGNTWHDNFWGSCMCPRCGNQGENKLGQLLMQLRKELRG